MFSTSVPFAVSIVVLCLVNCKSADALSDEVKYKYMDKDTSVRDINKLVHRDHVTFWTGRRDCQDLYDAGFRQNGLYEITPRYVKGPYLVYCDMDADSGHGWTVIQRRTDGSQNFLRVWDDYREGFGNLLNEVWLGNEPMFRITSANGRNYELLVELSDLDGNDFSALYSLFRVKGDRYRYKLKLGKFLGGSANDSLSFHNGAYFSTIDRDFDDAEGKHCAHKYKGGWWFKDCLESNLNGEYHADTLSPSGHGVYWFWLGGNYNMSYVYASMKIRPVQSSKRKRRPKKVKK